MGCQVNQTGRNRVSEMNVIESKYKESNITIGLLLGIPRVLVDLPTGYAGVDYLKDDKTTLKSLNEIYDRVMKKRTGRLLEIFYCRDCDSCLDIGKVGWCECGRTKRRMRYQSSVNNPIPKWCPLPVSQKRTTVR